jgi:hypothetical protein
MRGSICLHLKTMATISSPVSTNTPAHQRLAQALLSAWSTGDLARLAASLECASTSNDHGPLSREESDILALVIGIGTRMRDSLEPVNPEDLQVSLKLLHHLARVPA